MKRTINRLPSTAVLYLGAVAAMLALSILEAGAIDISTDTTISTPANFGSAAVNIGASGAVVTLTINSGGTVTSTGEWHVGQRG